MHRYQISDRNRIKPGIAEATRVMLRRVPDLLVLRDPGHADVAHLRQLAQEKRVRVAHDSTMPFGACALIRDVLNAACRQPEAKAAGAKTAGA